MALLALAVFCDHEAPLPAWKYTMFTSKLKRYSQPTPCPRPSGSSAAIDEAAALLQYKHCSYPVWRRSLIKAMIFLERRAGLSREEFRDWWLGSHRSLAERLPGLRRHAFNFLSDGPFDAVVEQWFDGHEALTACYGTEVGKSVAADSQAHTSNRRRVLVEEYAFDAATHNDSNRGEA